MRFRKLSEARVLAMLIMGALAGCSSMGPILHSMPDNMDGLFIELRVDKPPDSTALYRVTKDATLSFGGGSDAMQGKTDWSTDLTDEQRTKIMAMIDEFGWLRREPTSSPTNAENVYHVSVRRGSTRTECVVQGDNPQVVEMAVFLDQICRKRFDDYIDRLPQPGPPK